MSSDEGHRLTTGERTPADVKISHKLEEVGKEVGVENITAVAIAYVMHVRMFQWSATDFCLC